jgi:hypothetical protein
MGHPICDWLDLPSSYKSADLNSLFRSADEELLGSFATIVADLVAFCRKTKLSIYNGMAAALEALADVVEPLDEGVLSHVS